MVRCIKCKEDLTALDLEDDLIPCPNCGSTAREIDASIEETSPATDHFSMLQKRKGRAIGFSESKRGVAASSAEQTDNGSFSYRIVGSPPQGEGDTREVCQTLQRKLNLEGGTWGELRPGREEVDYECPSILEASEVLRIQVVRALTEQGFWKGLGTSGHVDRLRVSLSALLDTIRQAIEKKAKKNSSFFAAWPASCLRCKSTAGVCIRRCHGEIFSSTRTVGE